MEDLYHQNLRLPKRSKPPLDLLAEQINLGSIHGGHLKGTLGQPGYPTWWSDRSAATFIPSAASVRDLLGLEHFHGGWLVEMRYRPEGRFTLRAPTVLDASVRGENWVFVKNRHSGGPGWGYTLNLSVPEGQEGIPEAVQRAFHVPRRSGRMFQLRVIGDVGRTSALDYERIFTNPNV